MLKKLFVVLSGLFFVFPLFCESSSKLRSVDSLFPELDTEFRSVVFSPDGYIGTSETGAFTPAGSVADRHSLLDPAIAGTILNRHPGFVIESLLVIPSAPGAVTLLDVYNALGNIRGLKGQLYDSHSHGEKIPLFEDATRLESEKKSVPVPDPAPASVLPRSEIVFIRLKDVNFGNSHYRGEMKLDQYGLHYSLTNNKNLNYLFIPVIKEEKFTAQLYFEPLQEGILIYSIAGADVSNFVSTKIDMSSAISKRLAVIISWVREGIEKTNR